MILNLLQNKFFSFTALKSLVVLLGILLGSTVMLSAQYYWVGGTGNWSDAANHWATTSGGSSFHSVPPTSEDDVYFDANSFTESGQLVTLDEDYSYTRDLDFTGVQNFPGIEQDFWHDLRIYGSVIFSPDVNYNLSEVAMMSEGTDHTITSNGAYLGSISSVRKFLDGTCMLMDNLHVKDFFLLDGTFDTNDHDMFVESALRIDGSAEKEMVLGSSEVHCGQWRTYGPNTTITAETSTIYTYSMYANEDGSGSYSYNNLTFYENGGLIYGTSSFNVIDADSCSGNDFRFEGGTTITCNDFIITATKLAPVNMYVGAGEGHATVNKTSGSIDFEYVLMADIHATGGATFNVNPGVDYGNNDGWNFVDIVPLDYFWIGNGGNWEDTDHWATTSGGSEIYEELPSQFDNVIFDANSFSNDSQTVTINDDIALLTMDWTGVTNYPYLNAPYGNPIFMWGDFTLTEDMDKYIHGLYFYSNSETNIHFGDEGTIGYPNFYGSGPYNIHSDLTCGSFSHNGGTINTNGHDIYCSIDFKSQSGSNKVMNLGNSVISCRDLFINEYNIEFNPGTSEFRVRRDAQGNGLTYYDLVLEEEGSLYGSSTFHNLEFAPGVLAKLEAGSTQTVNNQIIILGTSIAPINISSTEAGTQATLLKTSGSVNATFLSLKDNIGGGGATYVADQSIDNGNNTNWTINEITPADFYWVGGSGDWSDNTNHWATSSGGSTFFNYVPGALDNVYFDENSFDATGQEVSIDIESINFHTMDWSGVTNTPNFSGYLKTMNVYGSMIMSEDMTYDVTNINFFSEETSTIDPGANGFPGTNSYLYFNASGTWNLMDSLTCRELSFETGTINTNNNGIHVDFATYFNGTGAKTINLGTSNYYSRSMSWFDWASGDNLTWNGSESNLIISSSLSPNSITPNNNILDYNDLHFQLEGFPDVGSINDDITVNTLTIDAGKEVKLFNSTTVTANSMVVQGTIDEYIYLHGSSDGIQGVISIESGIINGEFLELKDISGTGGATFYANSSLNLGNVSGWIFTGIAQTIDFPTIDDVMEDIGTFEVSATASSGLPVSYEIVSGPATVTGTTVTITGAGPVVIQASQEGDTEYNPAGSENNEFCAIPLQPIITGEIGSSAVMTSSSAQGNQWFIDGNDIDLANGQVYEGFDEGTYTVQVDIDGCVSEISEGFVVTDLGIDDWFLDLNLSVYPNPTTDIVTIRLNTTNTTNYTIYDLSGKLMTTGNLNVSENTINLSDLETGIYLVELQVNDSKIPVRVIKN